MNERERIEALAEEGRITRDEADRLLQVLEEIDGTEQDLDGVDEEVRRQETPPAPREARAPSAPAAPTAPMGPMRSTTQRPPPVGPEVISWVEVQLLAGDLEIEVDEHAQSPSVTGRGKGESSLEKTEHGYRVRGRMGGDDASLLGKLIGGIDGGSLRLTVPHGWGVKLAMKAGDVRVRGPLAFLSGQMLAGDIEASELHGVDLEVKAGDLDLTLRLGEGRHRVQAVAGDLNVRLHGGSDVTVRGRVSIGDLTIPAEWDRSGRGLGSRFDHTLGEGRASLDLSLGTGDLEVEVEK